MDKKKAIEEALKNISNSNTDYKYLEEFDNAKSKILKYIMFKKRTEQEVRNKFQNDFSLDLLDDVIEYLKEQKYIDDSDYIEKCVRDFMNLKKMSIKEIRFKLMQKGLENDLIENYISTHFEELFDFEVESVKSIFDKRRDKEPEDIKRYLYSKGYLSDTINYYLDNK